MSNPVKPISKKGHLIVFCIRALYFFVHLIKRTKWSRAKVHFGENPATMNWKDVLYFGYKYYYKSPQKASARRVEEYFEDQEIPYVLAPPNGGESQLSISLGGDLMPYECINTKQCTHLWDAMGEWFFDADIVTANLETPIVEDKPASLVPEVMLNDMDFNGSKEQFDVFSGLGKFKGFDLLATANNHSLDMGEEGVHETIKFLKKERVSYVGTSSNKEEASYKILEKNGIKIGFLSFTYSMNQYLPEEGKEYLVNYLPLNEPNCDISIVKEQCSELKKQGAEILFLHLHQGNAYQKFPCDNSVSLYHRLFNACGLDVIAGGHPHNAQPCEMYTFPCPWTAKKKKGFAIYSLGDFIAFDIYKDCQKPVMLKLHFEKKGNEVNLLGIERKDGILELGKKDGMLRLKEG